MKVRFYLLDYFTYADVEWNSSKLPKQGDEVFINEFLNVGESGEITHILDIGGTYYRTNLTKKERAVVDHYWVIKKLFNLRVTGSIIWRKIGDITTPCFLLTADNLTVVPDATKEIVDYDKYERY